MTLTTIQSLIVASFFALGQAEDTGLRVEVGFKNYEAQWSRWMAAACLDGSDRRVLFYGGKDLRVPQTSDKLFAFDLDEAKWHEIVTKGSSPSPLLSPAMAYATRERAIYLFGGWAPEADHPADEMWKLSAPFDGANWQKVSPKGVWPPGRNGTVLQYDARRSRLLLHRGDSGPHPEFGYTPMDDLWEFDLKTESWKRCTASGDSPRPRWNHAAVMDPKSETLYVFGGIGYTGRRLARDSRVFALKLSDLSWKRLPAGHLTPSPVQGTSLTYDESLNSIVMIGGLSVADDGPPGYKDLWIYDLENGEWSVAKNELHSTRQGHFAIYNGTSKSHIVFGGAEALVLGNFFKPGPPKLSVMTVRIHAE